MEVKNDKKVTGHNCSHHDHHHHGGDCGHDHHSHKHGESCGHDHHGHHGHKHGESCGHDHHHGHKHGESCGHDHHGHKHGDSCGHDHHHHGGGCGHDHHHHHHDAHEQEELLRIWGERAEGLRGNEEHDYVCEVYFNAALYAKMYGQNDEKYLEYLQKGVSFSAQHPELKEWESSFELELGTHYLEHGELTKAEEKIQKSLVYSREHNDKVGLAYGEFTLGCISAQKKEDAQAKELLERALKLVKENRESEELQALRPQIEEKLSALNTVSLKSKLLNFFK